MKHERDIYYNVYKKFTGVYKQSDRQITKNYLKCIDRASLVETKDNFYVVWSRNQKTGKVQGK